MDAVEIVDKVHVFGQDKRVAGHGSPTEILADAALLQADNLIRRHSHHARDNRAMNKDGQSCVDKFKRRL